MYIKILNFIKYGLCGISFILIGLLVMWVGLEYGNVYSTEDIYYFIISRFPFFVFITPIPTDVGLSYLLFLSGVIITILGGLYLEISYISKKIDEKILSIYKEFEVKKR